MGNGIDMSTNAFQMARRSSSSWGSQAISMCRAERFLVPPKEIRPKSHKLTDIKGGTASSYPRKKRRPSSAATGSASRLTAIRRHSEIGYHGEHTGCGPCGSSAPTADDGHARLTIERALKEYMEYTVVSDLFMTPTAQLADLVLPAAHWLEQDDVVFMHEVWCAMTRKKLAQIGEARDDRDVSSISHAASVSTMRSLPDRYVYLDWLCEGTGMRFEEFRKRISSWARCATESIRSRGSARLPTSSSSTLTSWSAQADHPCRSTSSRPVSGLCAQARAGLSFHPHDWHERTLLFPFGTAPDRFPAHAPPDPLVEINPETAARLGISDGDWVWVESPMQRSIKGKAFDGITPDVVNAEHAWWYPEAAPPDYRWKESCVNLLFGTTTLTRTQGGAAEVLRMQDRARLAPRSANS